MTHRRLFHTVSAACAAGLVLLAISAAADARDSVSLDGEWQFRIDPDAVGEQEAWFAADAAYDATIRVPGAWDAQGFGEETDKLRAHYIGKGWYRRTVRVPAAWTGKRVFLCVGGVHRYAKVWVNGHYLGEHIGYLSPFEYDITERVAGAPAGQDPAVTVALCVDSEQRWDVDTLLGCFDMIDYMDTYWGGIWGHVSIEARAGAYLEDLFVQPEVSPPGCRVSAAPVGDASACDTARLEVCDAAGGVVATAQRPLAEALQDGTIQLAAEVPGGRLWTPNAPYLYTARMSLLRNGEAIDTVATRFGLRRIEIRGTHLLLNGKRVFLHGYGDDCIYPETMAAPSDKQVYLERLKTAKAYGFNHVRHHSHLLPPEYYDACDEVGMLVSAEFPIGYQQFYDRAGDAALALYREEWAAVIKRFRNHPSIFDWCMGNEMWKAVPLSPDLYTIAKRLDPTRPVLDSDGLFKPGFIDGAADRDTLDFYFVMFDVFNTPLDVPGKFHCPAPLKPVVSHETGNYVTFPRFDLIDRFVHNMKPFWLTEAKAKMEQAGLLGEAEQWADNSERLYLLCHKLNTEALRKSPNLSGHHWWLLQDYWTTSNGLVDTYFRPKPAISPEEVSRFNADTVLLQDGLEIAYRAGDTLSVTLLVSNYAETALNGSTLTWRVRSGGVLLAEGEERPGSVGQGEVVKLSALELLLLPVTTPQQIEIDAELAADGRRYVNNWTAWVFPSSAAPAVSRPVFASGEVWPVAASCAAAPLPGEGELDASAVYLSSLLSGRILDAVERGACLVMLRPTGIFPSAITRWKTAWWHGDERDNNAGTVAYDHPVTRALAPDGWCDAGWYRMIENADGYLLDALPARPDVAIRGIEVASVCRDKALLFEASVGAGSILVSGLHLDAPQEHPEMAWILRRLVEYAATLPKPAAAFPASYLRERAADVPQFDGPFFEGFARLIRNEGEESEWFTYRETSAPGHICRQTQPGNAVEWDTAPVPAGFDGAAATFVFAGGLGWQSEPETDGFCLSVNGTDVFELDVVGNLTTWRNDELGAALALFPCHATAEDTAGLFYLRLPAALLTPGQPCRIAVRSRGTGSHRWFSLHPYTDVIARPAP